MHKQIKEMKIVLLVILLYSNYLTAQVNNKPTQEFTYEILEIDSSLDTLLVKQTEYDSLSRMVKQTIFKKHQFKNWYNSVKEYQYLSDTLREIHRTTDHDTFKVLTTHFIGNLKLRVEDRTIGWWESGKYKRNKHAVIRKNSYNKDLEEVETILYSESGDTSYVLKYNVEKSEDPFYIIKDTYDNKSKSKISRYIIQYNQDIDKQIDCSGNCTKRIFFKSDSLAASYISYDGSLIIESGDTTSLYINQIVELPDRHQAYSREKHDYVKNKSTKEVTYTNIKDLQYLKEWYTYSDRWRMQKSEEFQYLNKEIYKRTEYEYINEKRTITMETIYSWNETRTTKLATKKIYEDGAIKSRLETITKYVY